MPSRRASGCDSVRLRHLLLCAMAILSCHPRQERLTVIGLDGADWQLLDRYVSEGIMPNLGQLVRRGERRVLLTQHPPLSPLVWTSMMTGVSPLEHRILDFARFHPVTHALEPITSDERAVPALWNIATYAGKRVEVFGMWATYPAEQVEGVVVTDRDVTSETVHAAALPRIRKDRPDLAIVYFEGTDAIGHLHPDPNAAVVRSYYADIDRKLGEYAALDTNLLIVSDHGFRWFDPPNVSSTAPGTAAKWHRDEGIYLYAARSSRSAVRESPIRAAEVCARVLSLLGVRRDAVSDRRKFRRANPSTDTRGGDDQLAKLRALGYISGGGANATSTRTAASYDNEGLILRQLGRGDEARKAYEAALAIDPTSPSALWNLSELLQDDALLIRAMQNGFADVPQIVRRAQTSKDQIALLGAAIRAHDAPELHLYRGRYELEATNCRAALADFEQTADNALKFASIGTAQMCLGNRGAADAAFARSLQLDANQPDLRALLRR